MPENIINITQAMPEIPSAGQPPKQVKPDLGTPLMQTPIVLSSKRAREVTEKNLELLNQMTGKTFKL